MQKSKKFLFFWGIISFLVLRASLAVALELEYPTINGISLNSSSSLPEFARYFFNLGIELAILIAVGAIAYGGIYYIISFLKGSFRDEGKEIMKSGATGLLLVGLAYLIINTINPELLIFKIDGLPRISLNNLFNSSSPSGVTTDAYAEIPIGTLTEKLLTQTWYCYGFDSNGDPIGGEEMEKDNGKKIDGPTYLVHDRADCLVKLLDGIQKKSAVIAKVSDEIMKLMQTCNCEGKCTNSCNDNDNGCNDDPPLCSGSCKNASCESTGSESCCDNATKDRIEHGPIEIGEGCSKQNISIDPDFSKFTDTTQNNNACKVESLGAKITATQDVIIDSNVNLSAVQWAINEWNQYSPVGFTFFNNPIVDDDFVKSHCLVVTPYYNCKEATSFPPNNTVLIYSEQINVGGALPWNPAAFNHWQSNNGIMQWSEIDMDPDSPDTSSYNSYKMTVMHELGHSLGLADSYDTSTGMPVQNCNYKSVMNNSFIMSSAGSSDIAELNNLYSSSDTAYSNQKNQVATIKVQPSSFLSSLSFNNPLGLLTAKAQFSTDSYHGLDEFRCPNPISGAPYKSCGDEQNYIEEYVMAKEPYNGKITVIDLEKWEDLNLIQQLNYLKQKADALRKSIKDDATNLAAAEAKLGKCYLAVSYIDLLNNYEQTNQKQKLIVVQKYYSDSSSVSTQKYCSSFNYGYSECFQKCNQLCPDNSNEAIRLYAKCEQCENNNKECLERQEKCIEDAYKSRPCIYAKDASQKFEECISSCKDDCYEMCEDSNSSFGYDACTKECDNDSTCILENAKDCLFGSQGFVTCSKKVTDSGNIDKCLSEAYLCEGGSDQYAGYSDCYNKTIPGECSEYGYSSSFFYNNPECQKCQYASIAPPKSSVCYSSSDTKASCQQLCPETTKCPSSSECPSCSCGKIDMTFEFCLPKSSSLYNAGNEGSTTKTEKISALRVVSPQCNEYLYNDDPLTFYCKNQWWDDPSREGLLKDPIGSDGTCSKAKEIPVGQMVDGAEQWADNTLKEADEVIKGAQEILDKLGKISGKKPSDYCACDSKTDSGDQICKSDCKYQAASEDSEASCVFVPCRGNPCTQIITYLSDVWNISKKMKEDYIKLFIDMAQGSRSEVLKELSYSRKMTDACSVTQNNFESTTRMLSCSRAEDEVIPEIANGSVIIDEQTLKGYCYGKNIGKVLEKSLMDNWFCCNIKEKTTEEAK